MKRQKIAGIWADAAAFDGQQMTVCGWARNLRDMKNFGFIELNDGSCFKNLPVVFDADALNIIADKTDLLYDHPQDMILTPGDDGAFTVTVSAAVTMPFFGWLCTFGDGVRILGPASAVEGMRRHVEALAARYEEEE